MTFFILLIFIFLTCEDNEKGIISVNYLSGVPKISHAAATADSIFSC